MKLLGRNTFNKNQDVKLKNLFFKDVNLTIYFLFRKYINSLILVGMNIKLKN